jgi:hypothetical protein
VSTGPADALGPLLWEASGRFPPICPKGTTFQATMARPLRFEPSLVVQVSSLNLNQLQDLSEKGQDRCVVALTLLSTCEPLSSAGL